MYGVTKKHGVREQHSYKVKTCCMKSHPGCKKNYRRKNICSETNIQKVQNENIHICITYIYICPHETRSIISEKTTL